MGTSAMAVAGMEVSKVAPMGVCAIDPATPGDGSNTYYGFDKGIAYNLAEVNDLWKGVGKGDPIWLHPTAKSEQECKDDVNFNSSNSFSPFLCAGRSAVGTSDTVYANTGWEASQEGALNSRFRAPGESNDAFFSGMSAQLCPPDENVKELTTVDADWLTYSPNKQSATLTLTGNVIIDTPEDSVIASYVKPVNQSRIKSDYPAPSPYQTGIVNHSSKYYAPPLLLQV
jgi:hypothetical protein